MKELLKILGFLLFIVTFGLFSAITLFHVFTNYSNFLKYLFS